MKERCRKCGNAVHPATLTNGRCGSCHIDVQRRWEHRAATRTDQRGADRSWSSEAGAAMRAHRLALQREWAWTVAPDSPLTPQCRAAWLVWLKALHRWAVDFEGPDDVTLSEHPPLNYEGAE